MWDTAVVSSVSVQLKLLTLDILKLFSHWKGMTIDFSVIHGGSGGIGKILQKHENSEVRQLASKYMSR